MMPSTTFYTAVMEDYPFPISYCVNGKIIGGISKTGSLAINGQPIAMREFDVQKNGDVYTLSHDGYALCFDVKMAENAQVMVISGAGLVTVISLLTASPHFFDS